MRLVLDHEPGLELGQPEAQLSWSPAKHCYSSNINCYVKILYAIHTKYVTINKPFIGIFFPVTYRDCDSLAKLKQNS